MSSAVAATASGGTNSPSVAQPRGRALRQRARVPVHDPGRVPEEARRPGRRVAHGAVRQLQPGRVDAEQDRGPGAHRRREPVHRGDHGAGHQRREPRGVAARGHRPRRGGGVHVDDRAHLLDRQPQALRRHLPGHRGVALALRDRAEQHRDDALQVHRERARARSSRTCPGPACALGRGRREPDVADVGARRVDDQRQADAVVRALGAGALLARAQLVVAGALASSQVERGRVVAGVVDARRSASVRERVARGCGAAPRRRRARSARRRRPSGARARSRAAGRRSRG